jgi:exonuclease SbcC
MKIKKVEIEAFRAYQSKLNGTFDFTNDMNEAANFVAIFAPNGFGKSSFYDAVEWAITNRVKRLENYQSEAKSTKIRNEGLNILRNKYADEKTFTNVVISTNDQSVSFNRNLPKIRKNQNDICLGDNENDFFRHVILGQEAIEGFLREEKPQDRYSKFMEIYGGDLETARKELSALIYDNKADLSALNKKIKSLKVKLEQPIDISIFESFNSVAAELNSLGENIEIPNENLSTQTILKLDGFLLTRHNELNASLTANNKILESLSDSLSKIPKIKLHVDYQTEKKPRIAWLLKGIADAETYQKSFESHEKCLEDQKQANVRLKHLIELAKSTDYFLKTEARLKEITKTKGAFSEGCSNLNAELAGFQKNLDELDQELKSVENRTSLLRTTINKSDVTYNELSNNQSNRDDVSQKISNKNTEIKQYKNQEEILSGELSKLSKLTVTSSALLTGNIENLAFGQEKIERLARCYNEIDLLRAHDESLKATQKALADQMGLHQKLVSIGLDYLNIGPSSSCPLCTTPHSSPDQLVSNIKSQNLESKLSRENSNKIKESLSTQNKLNDEIQKITQQALEAQTYQLSNLRSQLHEVKVKLSKTEQETTTLEGELKKIESRNSELTQSVWGLPKQELLTRVESELSQLSGNKLSLIKQQEHLTAKKQATAESLKTKHIELSQLESEMVTKSSDHVYVSVLNYLNENSVTVLNMKSHFTIKKAELESIVKEYKTSCESLVSQCQDLQKKMITEGTWVDASHMKKEKETLDTAFANSQAEVDSYYNSLSNIISLSHDDTLEQIKILIKTKAENCRTHSQKLEKVANGIKLLLDLMGSFKPYIKHISTKKELDELQRQLQIRNKVDEALEKEKAIIIEKLEVLINNFFFEDLINSIYRKIDPHPTFRKVEFKVGFDTDKPNLNIMVSDESGGMISPVLYFSAAQTNILSLSVFLANALHAKDDKGKAIDVILVDDPIQSMDSINVLSTIDLLRSICLKFDKQIIISTHDENFFGLLQRKIPTEIFGSKFLQLEKFGVVVPVEPILN